MGCISSRSNEAAVDSTAGKSSRKYLAESIAPQTANRPGVGGEANKEIKLLLLGAGESGKSTIVKQIKIIHEQGFSQEEINQFLPIIYSNTIQSLYAIIAAMRRLNIALGDESRMEDANRITQVVTEQGDTEPFSDELSSAMKRVWADAGVQYCFRRSREYQLNDSAKYYLDSLSRIGGRRYQPTEQDILRTRVKSIGITETLFTYNKIRFKLVDVGGQRSERRKWVHCFQGVHAILYCVSLSAFDLTLREDNSVNRLHESIKLFTTVLNNKWFTEAAIIVLFNKKDLLELKLKESSITVCFPQYTGNNTYQEVSEYIKQQFIRVNRDLKRVLFSHYSCATDTDNIRFILDNITEDLIQANIITQKLL